MSTALDDWPPQSSLIWPPANRARFDNDVAAKLYRATLSSAVVHILLVPLKISTAFEAPERLLPPANMARLATDAAAETYRATLSSAVAQAPVSQLKMSTVLE